ncbi:MAG TPA: MBOAT family O-acyltransferase [Gemmataceae bacterium]|nr:MBOAT family O-acyltransferase [Gemmataceae bacterium]
MTFTEPAFLWLLLATYGLWLLVRRREPAAVGLLLTASLVFYGHKHWGLLPLLLGCCVADWAVALWVARGRRPRTALAVGVTLNLLLLAYYKYTPLLVETAARAAGLRLSPQALGTLEGWRVPFGISFYAFTGIAYMVDVYRRVTPAERSLVRYVLSAAFFPHLVAGPILRPNEFLAKLRPGQVPQRPEAPLEAFGLLARGLFKKLVLADRIALAIDPFFVHVNEPATAGVWALPYVYLYAWQIYFDFSAYTDIARGLGLLFGYRWPDNFHLPYLAESVAEFWRRWHVTLSRFLRDYLYVPLGGSRRGRWRTGVNLLATMLLGGLWHGASWSFLLWGGLHGSFLVLHRAWCLCPLRDALAAVTGWRRGLWRGCCVLLTFHGVCLAWCFFRLTALGESLACVRKWVAFDGDKRLVGGAADPSLWLALAGYGLAVALAAASGRLEVWARLRSGPAGAALWHGFQWGCRVAVLLLAALLAPGGAAPPFIYFQF